MVAGVCTAPSTGWGAARVGPGQQCCYTESRVKPSDSPEFLMTVVTPVLDGDLANQVAW